MIGINVTSTPGAHYSSATNATSHFSFNPYSLGTALAVIGNTLIAVSLNVQKYAHRKRETQEEEEESSLCGPNSYLRSYTWWVGIVLMAVGEVGNFVAYGFAPASVVAPLGCVAVLVNGGLAMVFNNESLRMRDVVGASFAIVGSFLVVTFSSKPKLILNAQELIAHLGGWQFIIYMFLEIVMFGIIIFIKSQDVKNVFIHLSLVAILGSFTVISAKAVSGLLALTLEGKSQLGEPILYIMVVIMIGTTLFQVKYLNAAMRLYDIATVVPINFVLFTISAILAGTLFYQELSREPGINILMFIFGCLLSFMGVIFIAGDKGERGDPHEAGALHLDMMPNFVRYLAPSFLTTEVQPVRNDHQSKCYPDHEPGCSSGSDGSEGTEGTYDADYTQHNSTLDTET
uniref:NIPA-like protein 2 n=1 Tax=Ciona savignyi TaxID=51511 RepID=H2YYE4_CIOSA